jgi:periplasmic protein TonB
MTQGGFFEPKRMSPTGLTLVIAMHAAALGALALIKGPEIVERLGPIELIDVTPDPVPPEPQPEPPRDQRRPQQERSVLDSMPTPIERPIQRPVVIDVAPPTRPFDLAGSETIPPPRIDPPPPPVRIDAEFDPRFAGDLQPPYPAAEQRAQREGSVRLRLTIGADGRVKAVRRLAASSDAFWSATERHARSRWRFRPATLDGRPVESSKVMTVFFRIEA